MNLHDLVEAYRKDICLFVEQEFGVKPEPYQKAALEAFADPSYKVRKIVMCSSAGVGKSAVLSWATLWFMLTQGREGHHPKGVMASMNLPNLMDGLHRECAKWLGISKLLSELFEINNKRIAAKGHSQTWNTSVRTYNPNTDREEAGRVLSGLHGEFLLYTVDEAGGIIPEIGKSINQGLGETQARFVRVIMAGNPMSRDSLLYKESQDKKNWVFHISSDPDDPMRSQRVSKERAQAEIDEFGRNDTWVKIFILGQFPETSLDSLLSEPEVEAAMARDDVRPDPERELKLGVDCARFGGDSNIWFPRRGRYAYQYSVLRDARTMDMMAKTISVLNNHGEGAVLIDSTGGYGSGLADAMIEAGYSPHEINFGERANREEKFFNKRSEMYWEMAQWIKKGGRLPRCPELKKELTSIMCTYNDKGQFRLEGKEMTRKRLKMSPDRADALALTFAVPDSSVMAVADDDWDDRPLSNEDIYNYGV